MYLTRYGARRQNQRISESLYQQIIIPLIYIKFRLLITPDVLNIVFITDDSIFYLRRSYLQHRHARRQKTNSISKEPSSNQSMNRTTAVRKKLQSPAVSHDRNHDSHSQISGREQHWLVIDSKHISEGKVCYDSQIFSHNEDDENQVFREIRSNTEEDEKGSCPGNQKRQVLTFQENNDVERIRCKLTVDINVDLERNKRRKNIEAKTVHIELNLDSVSHDTKL